MKFRILIDSLLVGKDAQKHFTDAIYYEPEDLAEDNYARVFLHIEIRDNPKGSREVTQRILDTLKEDLYKDLKRDPYDAFEDSLKCINDALNNLKLDSKDWIGKVHATLGVLSGDTLHVTTTGNAEVILSRNGKMSIISEGIAPDDTVYDNMFVNIASGNMKEDDYLIISSTSILNHIKEEQLTTAITNKQLANGILSLEKLLGTTYHSALLISVQPAFKDSAQLEREDINYDDLDEDTSDLESKSSISKKDISKSAKNYFNKGKNILYKMKEIFVPPEDSEVLSEDITIEDLDKSLESRAASETSMTREYNLDGIDKKESLDDIKSAIEKDEYQHTKPQSQLDDNKLSNTVNLLKRNVLDSLRGAKPSKKVVSGLKKSNVIGILIIVLVVIFAINSVYSKHKENQTIEVLREQLLDVDNLIEKAKGRNIIDEKAKARDILVQVDNRLDELAQSEYLINEIEDKRSSIKDLSDSINEIIRIDVPKEYANLEEKSFSVPLLDLLSLNDDLYAITKDAILKLILDKIVRIEVPLNDDEEITKAVVFDTEVSILMYTNQNRILEYRRDEVTENKLLTDDAKWKNTVDIGSFGRRIYLLDPTEDQIWKYGKQANGFIDPTEYKPNNVDLKDALSMSIVGDIYILKSGGNIVRTNRQEVIDFELQEFPEETDISSATRITMNPVMKQLFIFDPANSRIVVTGYRGLYAKQYVFPSIVGPLKDMYTDENTRKMYILTDKKVYEIDLES